MIQSEEEYKAKLTMLDKIFDHNTTEVSILVDEIAQWEDKHYPIPEPSQDSIDEFMKDQQIKD